MDPERLVWTGLFQLPDARKREKRSMREATMSINTVLDKLVNGQKLTERCWKILFEVCYQRLTAFFRRRGVPREDSKDLAQQSLLDLWRALKKRRPLTKAGFWALLFTIARRRLYDYFNRQGQIPEEVDDVADQETTNPLDYAAADQERKNLMKALDRLTERQRNVLILRFYHELPWEEIARILKITPGGARSLGNQALNALRRVFPGVLEKPRENTENDRRLNKHNQEEAVTGNNGKQEKAENKGGHDE